LKGGKKKNPPHKPPRKNCRYLEMPNTKSQVEPTLKMAEKERSGVGKERRGKDRETSYNSNLFKGDVVSAPLAHKWQYALITLLRPKKIDGNWEKHCRLCRGGGIRKSTSWPYPALLTRRLMRKIRRLGPKRRDRQEVRKTLR